ncbi:MAG: PKD domain-containing protein [Flavobacteriales bacterium]|nr:PKD domain-containing protein [Flavobacteriales bacterium]
MAAVLGVFAARDTFATHMVGGDLHYECLGGNEYMIVLKVFRDCQQSTTPFDDPACIGIYNSSGTMVMNLQIPLADAVITNLPISTGSPCFIAPTDLCIEQCVFTGYATLPPIPGGYHLSYQRCCRNTELLNTTSLDNLGMTLIAQIPDESLAVCNSNPEFYEYPPVAICLGQNFVFNHGANDIDGDSLVYSFCNPLDDNATGFYICPPGGPPFPDIIFNAGYTYDYPIDSDPAFEIDSQTGLLTGTPNTLGKYVVGICVEEYRNGELISTTNRDFQFNIVLCDQFIQAEVPEPDPCEGMTFTFDNESVGDFYHWDFGVEELTDDTSNLYEPVWTYDEVGIYEVTLIVNPGFQCADTVYVDAYASPPIYPEITDVGPDCVNEQWQFNFSETGITDAADVFVWTFEGGDPELSGVEDPGIVVFDVSGPHAIVLEASNEICTSVDSITVDVPPIAHADALADQVSCTGLEVQFTNNSSDATSWLWQFGDGAESDDYAPLHTYPASGTYSVTLIAYGETACGGVDTLEFDIDVIPAQDMEALFTVQQSGECGLLNVQTTNLSLGMNLDYFWTFGDGLNSTEEEPTHMYVAPGTYTITLYIDNEECEMEDEYSTQVTVVGIPELEMPPVYSLCYYEDGETIAAAETGVPTTYLWSTGETTASITVDAPGTYTVTLTFNGCEYTHDVLVEEIGEAPVFSEVEFCEGSSVSLEVPAAYGDNVNWCDGTTAPVINADEPGEYCYTFVDNDGCLQHGIISVTIGGFIASLYLPNSFTPNGDGINDVYLPVGVGIYEYQLRIFNRWGEKVFDTTDPLWPWDGSYNGGEYFAPDGLYQFICQYRGECSPETVQRKGFIVLIR